MILCVTCLLLYGCAFSHADIKRNPKKVAADTSPQHESNPALSPLRLFWKHISRADGNRCPMYPSCSTYCADAVQKHGYVAGFVMTCDRLMRCGGDELKTTPPVETPAGIRCPDPVDNNDFWWN